MDTTMDFVSAKEVFVPGICNYKAHILALGLDHFSSFLSAVSAVSPAWPSYNAILPYSYCLI